MEAAREALAHYRAALRDRNVALLLAGGIVSEIGDWFNTVALISLSYRLGDGSLAVGGMFAMRMVIRLIFQGPAGAFVDRHAGRALLLATQLIMAAIAASFAILVALPKLWLLYVLVIALETVNCVARPAFMVELRAEAPAERRAAANGALFAGQTTAQLIGPVLGAVALAALGAGPVFLLNGLTFLGVALAVALLRGSPHSLAEPAGDKVGEASSPRPAVDTGKGGYRLLLRRADLGLYALVCASLALLVQATVTLFIVRAAALGLEDGAVGLFFAAVGVGSIAGSVVAGGRKSGTLSLYPAAIAMGICALAVAWFGLAWSTAVAILALVIAGFATDFYEVVGLTYFQGSLPEGVFARFYSVFVLALSAGALVGAFAGPLGEESFGLPVTLVALAAPGFALAILLAIYSRRTEPESS
jgi:MFS family permease